MAQKVHPTQGEASSQLTSGAIAWAGHSDWVVPGGSDYLATFAGLSGTPLNGFSESHSASSFDVTIDTGEAFVGGRWIAKDQTTTVTLASGTSNQTVYAGWESSTANSVVIGLDSAFSSTDDGRRTPIWEFDTDGSGVTNADPLHDTEPIHPHAAVADDATALSGVSPSNYARTDQSETFGSEVTFGGGVDLNGTSITNVGTFEIEDTDTGFRMGANPSGDRPWIAPIINGSPSFGRELMYNGHWQVESAFTIDNSGEGFRIDGNSTSSFIAPIEGGSVMFGPSLDYNKDNNRWEVGDNMVIENEHVVTSGSDYEIQVDGTDGAGIINFKTQ